MLKMIENHECNLIINKEFVGVEKYNLNAEECWFLRINTDLNIIRYCPYCGVKLLVEGRE